MRDVGKNASTGKLNYCVWSKCKWSIHTIADFRNIVCNDTAHDYKKSIFQRESLRRRCDLQT